MSSIVHFEIPADDIQRAKTFYSNLFGWKIENMHGMDYMLIDTSQPLDHALFAYLLRREQLY